MQIEFLILAGLLILTAIAFVLLPLLRSNLVSSHDQLQARKLANVANYQSEKDDIQQQLVAGDIDEQQASKLLSELDLALLDDSKNEQQLSLRAGSIGMWWLVPGILLPLLSIGFYGKLGGIDELELQRQLEGLSQPETIEEQRQQLLNIHQTIQDVALKHGEKKPDYWVLAGQTAMNGQDYRAAEMNYAELAKVFPDDAEVIAYWAQAAFLAAERQMTSRIAGLTERALALNPNQTTALGLIGIAAFEAQDYAKAVEAWGKIVNAMPKGSPDADVIMQGINSAMALAAAAGVEVAMPVRDNGPLIMVSVSLSDELLKAGLELSDQAILYVFAQAESGPKMPLAVQRLNPRSLPVAITLDDTMGMTPAMRLSQFERVTVGARISQSGAVMANAGDYEVGKVVHLNISDDELVADLVIDQRRQ